MFNATEIVIDTFVERLRQAYQRSYGSLESRYGEILEWAGRMSLERIAESDAFYHTVEHTVMVTLVGQEILRGKHMRVGGVAPGDWLQFLISLLCHDIGYVRGICRADKGELPPRPRRQGASLRRCACRAGPRGRSWRARRGARRHPRRSGRRPRRPRARSRTRWARGRCVAGGARRGPCPNRWGVGPRARSVRPEPGSPLR